MAGLLALVLKRRNAPKHLRQIVLDVRTGHSNAWVGENTDIFLVISIH